MSIPVRATCSVGKNIVFLPYGKHSCVGNESDESTVSEPSTDAGRVSDAGRKDLHATDD
jgi:hypothetical protein